MNQRTHSWRGRAAGEPVAVLLVTLLALSPLGSAAAVPGVAWAAGSSSLVSVAGWPSFAPASSTDAAASGVPAGALSPADAATRERVNEGFGKLPLYFIENRGQVDARAAYYVQGATTSVYFTKTGIVYALTSRSASLSPRGLGAEQAQTQRHAIRLDFEGANPDVKLVGQERTEAVVSYFKGAASSWKTALPTYEGVVYEELWPGIDLVYGGEGGKPKYSFVVKPGADPSRIRLVYRGASAVRLTPAGRLKVETTAGGFEEDVPYAYQEEAGARSEVQAAFEPDAGTPDEGYRFGFRVGAYDTSQVLVLDPVVLVYCGYIGGSANDVGRAIKVDGAGNAYVTGYAASTEASFPVSVGPDLTYNAGPWDVFVAKINAAGTALVYCGYIGGSADDEAYALAIDGSGNAYVVGTTTSTEAQGFPVTLGPDLTFNGLTYDAWVAKVNAAGTALVYCGYIGGAGNETAEGIAVDAAGSAYVTGYTNSNGTFPVTGGSWDTSYNLGAYDAFAVKIQPVPNDPTPLNNYVYSGYLGGDQEDRGSAIAIDGAGNAYVVGFTLSGISWAAIVGPDLSYNGGQDGFVAKINPAGTALVYRGYIGGTALETASSIAVDSSGNAYVGGQTASTEATFPEAVGPDLTFNGGTYDAWAAKINAAGSALVYCGYIGGAADDFLSGIAIDGAGSAYAIGYTGSNEASFPVTGGPDLTYNGGTYDAFVSKLNAAGTALVYSGYIGGSGDERYGGIAVDASDNAYVVGGTGSTQATFPVLVGPDITHNGTSDAWVAKIDASECCAFSTVEVPGSTVTVTGAGQFEMVFNTLRGGGIDDFFDLAEDPTRTLDLAGKDSLNLWGLFHSSMEAPAAVLYTTGTNSSGAKLDLLEATATRVKVRQESFYQQVLPSTTILPGVKGIGDYSVYGQRVALRWNRKITAAVPDQDDHALEITVHREAAGVLNPMNLYSQSGSAFPAPAGDDFVLAQREVAGSPGVRTDFLGIQSSDWAAADTLTASITGSYFSWRDTTDNQALAAGLDEKWNFLIYYKPTNLLDNTDTAVTTRSSDYRIPSAVSVGPGTQWQDAAEGTSAAGDFFNESEAAYVFDINPTTGLSFDLDGSGTTRYSPFFKVRQWRSLAAPSTITVEGVSKTRNVAYRADVKPVARAHFAQDLLWYSTIEDTAALSSPNVGSPGSSLGITFVPGRYGSGLDFTVANSYIQFPTADFDKAKGAVEFWVRPYYASTDGVEHNLAGFRAGPNDEWVLRKATDNSLNFIITANSVTSQLTVSAANYSWRAYDWVHIRMEWDDSVVCGASCPGQQRILLNGIEPVHADPVVDYASAALALAASFRVGSYRNGAADAAGLYDEVYSFGGSASLPAALARGGLASDAREYLADGGRNFSLSFAGVDATRRGEYLYVGSDAKFHGLNVLLATNGVSGMAPGTLIWEYWNGNGWADLESVAGFGDTTNDFRKPGNLYWTADPGGWSPYSVSGGPDLYYVRAHLPTGASYAPAPVEYKITTDILLFQYCSDVTLAGQTFVFGAPATTAVRLQSFGAVPGDGSVLLEWRTASELSNLGFHVYRSLSEVGPWTRLTASLVPGLGSSAVGQGYSYRDVGLTNGTRYLYRLEDVDASSKATSHGPVSAVPLAGAAGVAPGSEPPTSGGRKKAASSSCPDWVLAAYGSMAGPSSSSLSCTRHGDPEAVALGVVSRDARSATLELRTGGFYALHEASGTVRVFVPGFDFPQDSQRPALPFRRALVDAVVGRRVQLAGMRALELQGFRDLVPSALGRAEMEVSKDGTVRAGRRAPRGALPRHVSSDLARLLPSVFQGETKSAVVEISPLRFDARRQQLVLAKRVRVRLLFTGREAGESGRGNVGRRERREKAVTGELLARLYTTSRGLHAVSFEQLFPGRLRGFASSQLRLERQGQPSGVHFEPAGDLFGPGSVLYFHADTTASSTDFSSEVAWELVRARGGVLMPLVSAPPSGSAVTTASTGQASFETNRFYQPGLLEAPDPWLWEAIASGATRAKVLSLASLSSASAGAAELEVFLQGASESGNPVDHHVSVSVNGVLAGEAQFAGKTPYQMSLSVPLSLLREGANELALTNVADTGVSSLVFLDRFKIRYPQTSSLEGGVLEGTWAESGAATVGGLTTPPFVLDVTGASASPTSGARWLTDYEATGASLRFRAEAGHFYLVVSPQALLTPRVAAASGSTLRATTNQADYVLIAPRAFLAAAEPLVQRRLDQGLQARAVAFEEIADEFGHGQPSAEAIKSFLAFAFQSWARPSPRYVLLLGDASYDPRNFMGSSRLSPLPALWAKTSYLWTVSDPQLAAVNGEDELPDLAIGRLPATTVEQAQALVDKLIAWENSGQALSGQAVLVADNPDLAGDFEANGEDIAHSFLEGRSELLLVRELGTWTRPRIQAALDSGLSFLSYVGHGGAAVWASENVWNSWDAASLQAQSRQPLLLTLNCLNGYFVAPAFDSLSESLLNAEGRGAIAAFSPSGLSLDGPAHQYHRALMAELTSGRHARLGDAILAAQKTYADSGLMPELLAVYHLLGDPATRIDR